MKKPFPWGMVLMSTVLGALLVGILAYAVINQGAGFVDPLDKADDSVSGVQKFDKLDRDHVQTTVDYPQQPPVGGKHAGVWQNCAVYTSPIANENAVHSLEHGAVWVTYRPGLAAEQVSALAAKVEGNPFRLMTPYPNLKSPISLQAWGRQIFVDSPNDKKVDQFLEAYTQGPQKPENGSCAGGTSSTGPLQAPPPAPAPASGAPAPSGAASVPASPVSSPSASG